MSAAAVHRPPRSLQPIPPDRLRNYVQISWEHGRDTADIAQRINWLCLYQPIAEGEVANILAGIKDRRP